MATNFNDLGQCACGMQGEWVDTGKRGQSRVREVRVTDENGTTHRSTWTWQDGVGTDVGMRGVCHGS